MSIVPSEELTDHKCQNPVKGKKNQPGKENTIRLLILTPAPWFEIPDMHVFVLLSGGKYHQKPDINEFLQTVIF